jgi:hypothetical protein
MRIHAPTDRLSVRARTTARVDRGVAIRPVVSNVVERRGVIDSPVAGRVRFILPERNG